MSQQRLLRDVVPQDRLSVGLISDVLSEHPRIGRWSREESGAIRPRRLAQVVLSNLWLGLNKPVAEMKKGLETTPRGALDYCYRVTVRDEPNGAAVALAVRAKLRRRWSGRIVAEIELENRAITHSPFVLPRL